MGLFGKKKAQGKYGSAAKAKPENYYDYALLFLIIFVACFGLVMVYSASYYQASLKYDDGAYFLKKQAQFVLMGIFAMIVVSLLDYHWYTNFQMAVLAIIVANVLMVLTNFTPLGIERNGSKRWIGYGPISFQSSEIVKIAIIVATACLLSRFYRYLHRKIVLFFLFVEIVPLFLWVAMENLSTAIIVMAIPFGMYFVASKNYKFFLYLAGFGGVAVAGLILVINWLYSMGKLSGYRFSRILVWQNPEAFPQRGGYQVLQGLYAIGSGGLFGKGLGNSMQKLKYLPESQNDMIFSIICEELGLFGALCVIALFLYILYRFMIIANNAPDMLGSMVVIGVMAQIAVQVVLNIMVVTNLIPNTGVSLPFISYGGTSLLLLFIEIGMVLGVSRKIVVEQE